MSDIVAQLEVLSQESGCLLDLSAILDLSICPKIDLKTEKDHKVEEKDDVICVTPTKDHGHKKEKRCGDKSCYEVSDKVCKKSHVALDFEILVILGLLTQEDLEKYLKTIGEMDEDDRLDMDEKDVKMDPLLSLDVGDDDNNILDLEVGGEDGLLNLDLLGQEGLLNLGGDGPLLNLGGGSGLLGLGGDDNDGGLLGGILRRRGSYSHPHHGGSRKGNNGLLDIDVGGKKDKDEAAIDVDVITHERLVRRREYNQRLLDVDVGGKKDKDQAAIDVDVLTHSKRQNKGLLDIDVGGFRDEDEATIDLDLLTRPRPNGGNGNGNNGNNGNGNGNNGNNGNGNGNNGNNGNDDADRADDKDGKHHGGYLSHYQPICKKGFKPGHSDKTKKCHANDVNHCLAICHSQSALLTLEADVQVGDIANILLCAAIEFNSSEDGDNCQYVVAPESEPCHDEELEEKENCFTFVRN